MKLLGFLLLTAAFLSAGCAYAGKLRGRARETEELEKTVLLLRFEMERFCPPMPELAQWMAAHAPGAGQTLFARLCGLLPLLGDEEFSALWNRACAFLEPELRSVISPLGEVLGRYDGPEQILALERAAGELTLRKEAALHKAAEGGKLAVACGGALGLVLAIMLI